jgi:hypothetical protein
VVFPMLICFSLFFHTVISRADVQGTQCFSCHWFIGLCWCWLSFSILFCVRASYTLAQHHLEACEEALYIDLSFLSVHFSGSQRTSRSLILRNLFHRRLHSEDLMWILDHVILGLILLTIQRSDLFFPYNGGAIRLSWTELCVVCQSETVLIPRFTLRPTL